MLVLSKIVQGFYLASAASVASLPFLPPDLRDFLLDYGSRRGRLARGLAAYAEVPHSWFWHYYAFSVGLSGFWAWQYLVRGAVLKDLVSRQASARAGPSVPLDRTVLAWIVMALQASRRLYECLFVMRPGKTPMMILHWALGLGYYAANSAAVWVEGSGAILDSWKSPSSLASLPSLRSFAALAVISAAWLKQNECHRHLAGLKKYTLPNDGMFRYLVCPHYTCECVIYLGLSFLAAPPGSTFNTTLLCNLAFVVMNLGVTASNTKKWYAGKFGTEAVARKWTMIPYVF